MLYQTTIRLNSLYRYSKFLGFGAPVSKNNVRTVITALQSDSNTSPEATAPIGRPTVVYRRPVLRAPLPSEEIHAAVFQSLRFYKSGVVTALQKADAEAAERLVVQTLQEQKDGIKFVSNLDQFVKLLLPLQDHSGKSSGIKSAPEELRPPVFRFRLYNAAIRKLQKLHVPLNKEVIFWGIYLAVRARSAMAIQHYFRLAVENKLDVTHVKSGSIMRSLRDWVENHSFTGWQGLRRKQRLSFVLTGWTGWENTVMDRRHASRQSCVWQMGLVKDKRFLLEYLFILWKLWGAKTVFNEWLYLKESPEWQELSISRPGKPQLGTIATTEAFVQALLLSQNQKLAWQIVEFSGCKLKYLSWNICKQLLKYPEYITNWEKEMEKLLLQKYEEDIIQIEIAMGVYWSGRKKGFHVPFPPKGS